MGNHGASWELAGVLLDGEGPKAGTGRSTITQSVVPIWKRLSPFLHGPCLPVSWPLKLILADCYPVCALPASLCPFSGARPMHMTDLMDPDCNTTIAAGYGKIRSLYTLGFGHGSAATLVCLCFQSCPFEHSAAMGCGRSTGRDRAAQACLRCLSTVGQRPWMEAVSCHIQTGLGNGFRSLRELFR